MLVSQLANQLFDLFASWLAYSKLQVQQSSRRTFRVMTYCSGFQWPRLIFVGTPTGSRVWSETCRSCLSLGLRVICLVRNAGHPVLPRTCSRVCEFENRSPNSVWASLYKIQLHSCCTSSVSSSDANRKLGRRPMRSCYLHLSSLLAESSYSGNGTMTSRKKFPSDSILSEFRRSSSTETHRCSDSRTLDHASLHCD